MKKRKMSKGEARKYTLALLNKADKLLSQLQEGDVIFVSTSATINSIPLYVQERWKVTRVVRAKNSLIGLFFHKLKCPVTEGFFLGGRTMSDSSVDNYAVHNNFANNTIIDVLNVSMDPVRKQVNDISLGCASLKFFRPSGSNMTFRTLDELRQAVEGKGTASRRNCLARVRQGEVRVLFE